jgi:GTP1/Obg family GTP-binding protein
MLNGIIDSRKVRAQKATTSSQSTGRSSFIPHRSEHQLKIKMLKESLRQRNEEMMQRDEEMRQRDDFYTSAFT